MLSRTFLPMIQSGQAMGNQTALRQLQRIQAHKGIAGSPISKSQTLGFLGAQNNNALQQAFQQAFGLAGQRAGIWSGSSVPQTQPNYNMSNALLQATQQGLLAAALGKGGNQPNGPYTPAQSPQLWQNPTWGLPPTYGQGQVY